MSYHIWTNVEGEPEAAGGPPSHGGGTDFSCEKGKHRLHNPCIVLFNNIYFMYMIVHLHI
jgi:hypothetical protein